MKNIEYIDHHFDQESGSLTILYDLDGIPQEDIELTQEQVCTALVAAYYLTKFTENTVSFHMDWFAGGMRETWVDYTRYMKDELSASFCEIILTAHLQTVSHDLL